MINLPEGYWQAVENLAFFALRLSQESQTPAMALLPDETVLNATLDDMMEYCENFYSETQRKQWEHLETICKTVCETYKTTMELTFGHVYARMMLYDYQNEVAEK